MQQLAFPIQYIRQQAAAIDVDQVFSTTAARTSYLTNARRYPGQVVSDTQTGDVYMLNAAGTAWITIGGTGAGVASIASSDGSLTFSAATGTVDAVLNVAHANTWTATQNLFLNGLGTTTNDAWRLSNTTAAAAGAQQISPSLVFRGQGWKTNATAASQTVVFQMYVLPVQGAVSPTGIWRLQASINGAGATDVFTVDNSGNALITGSLSLGALSTSTALLSLAGTTAKSSFRIPIGVAPTSPVQGDFWATSGQLLYRDGSTTYNLLAPTLANNNFTATFANVSNTTLITHIRSVYTQIGKVVTVTVAANVQATANSTTSFTISLPVSSAQSLSFTCGTIFVNETSFSVVTGLVTIATFPTAVTAEYVAVAGAGSLVPFLAVFTYTVVD